MSTPAVKRDKALPAAKAMGIFRHHGALGIGIAVLTYAFILFLMLTAVAPKRYDLAAGDIAPESIPATRDVEDRTATQQRILEAREKVPDIYTLDQIITGDIIGEVQGIFAGIDGVRTMALERLQEWEEAAREAWEQQQELPTQETEEEATAEAPEPPVFEMPRPDPEMLYDEEFLAAAQGLLSIELSREDLLTVILAEQREINQLNTRLTALLAERLESGIKLEQLTESKVSLREDIQALPVSSEIKGLGVSIGAPLLQANMLFDMEKTIAEKQRAAARVDKVLLKKGQFIVQAGQPVQESQIELLRELSLLQDDTVDIPFYAGVAILVLMIQGALMLYLVYFEKDLLRKPSLLLLLSLILCLVLGFGYIIAWMHPYAIPAAMAGIMLAVLLKPRIGIMINMTLALLFGFMFQYHLGILLMVIAGGLMGICLLNNMQQRNTLIWAGMGVSCINILVLGGYEMLTAGSGWLSSLYTALWGAAGGMFSAVLALGMLPIFENLFHVITPLKLLELANPNQPVLKRLLMETPGTYHHSIIVANLAENAAESVGANGLLARVGAYYHDIGKLQRPYYFKENQLYSENPHDRMDPMLSTRIITAHTMDGIEMAKRYKVPKILQDFILEHHGTTAVAYFYHKAKNHEDGGEAAKELKLDQFRYTGPKPASRETAIVMMADTVEAAVRSLSEPTPDKVESLIRKLIRDKMEDGQLDNCPLTIRDIKAIGTAFSAAIGGIFHERVKYPDIKEQKG